MKNRKTMMFIAAVLLVALAAPAAAVAYFTDYEEAHGGALLQLEGETKIHEEADSDKKVISIENTGETDVVVRVAVYGDFVNEIEYDEKDWAKAEGDEWYYYRKILKPGESTPAITAWVDKEAAQEAGHDFEIVVVHESERVSYDGTAQNKVNRPEGWDRMPVITGSEEVGD